MHCIFTWGPPWANTSSLRNIIHPQEIEMGPLKRCVAAYMAGGVMHTQSFPPPMECILIVHTRWPTELNKLNKNNNNRLCVCSPHGKYTSWNHVIQSWLIRLGKHWNRISIMSAIDSKKEKKKCQKGSNFSTHFLAFFCKINEKKKKRPFKAAKPRPRVRPHIQKTTQNKQTDQKQTNRPKTNKQTKNKQTKTNKQNSVGTSPGKWVSVFFFRRSTQNYNMNRAEVNSYPEASSCSDSFRFFFPMHVLKVLVPRRW